MIFLNNEEINFEQFPNGETRVPTPLPIRRDNHITFKYETDADLVHLMFLKKKLDAEGAADVGLHIMYMPYSRQDRVEGDSTFTLKYVCEFINSLNFSIISVEEPHSEVTPALLERCDSHNLSVMIAGMSMDKIGFDPQNDVIFFPDAGAQKRYANNFDKCKQAVGFKHRNFQTGRIESYQILGEIPIGSKVVIVDDLCSYGGTFNAAAAALKEAGAGDIYLVVAHCEDNIFKGSLLKDGSNIKKVFTTNTMLTFESDDNIHVFNLLGGSH